MQYVLAKLENPTNGIGNRFAETLEKDLWNNKWVWIMEENNLRRKGGNFYISVNWCLNSLKRNLQKNTIFQTYRQKETNY